MEDKGKIKQIVIKKYSEIVIGGSSCCPMNVCCTPGTPTESLLETGRKLGYSDDELRIGLGEANLGLGCGNPNAIADLREGETVLDLGCGAGFDAFLSSMKVGKNGFVIGIDMTPEMVEKAKENAENLGIKNVEFRLSEIERLPLEDSSADVIISNCVINLSPDKQVVFNEAFRVLRPRGRLAISDILKKGEFSKAIKQNKDAYSGWITGSVPVEELKRILEKAGFTEVTIIEKEKSDEIIRSWSFGEGVEEMVLSAYIKAKKPCTNK